AFSGLAGDMLVGAFADAGADREAISNALGSLATGGYIAWDRVLRRGMSASKFRVSVNEPQKHRHLTGILKMIAAADLPGPVKENSERVFRVLAEAESAVHGVSVEKVHFHEVGAVDSICDIVGACYALHLLSIETLYCSPIYVGSGTVNTEHGVLPVPAPATARLLQGRPIYSRGPAMELATPTGAAFVTALAKDFGAMPPMRVKSIGYGAGDREFPEHANLLRVMVGEPTGAPESTTVCVIEANIDDSSPQLIGYALERLLEAGALDALVLAAQMKKGRPGVVLQVIVAPERREEMVAILFRETTTLGVRFYSAERRVQPRSTVDVATKYGAIPVKIGGDGFAPEYEDARRIARQAGVPLKDVLAEAAHEYLRTK
ncbi:MAG: nickel pincer cofactor biosynthesis protein LarC, partial [Acidobacteriota bacterium]|nr:nickel pincer cofactor biosynthesis protein LarC [Acidobacteriota bacterium]